jgi:uncharacterized protein YjbI with pentapeptide repeats
MVQSKFKSKSLKGRSFRGENLSGENFANSDIRSCDFSGAILEGTNFSGATLGLNRKHKIILIFTAILLAFIAGIVASLAAGVFFIAFQKSLGQSFLIVIFLLAGILTIGTTRYGYILLASVIAVAIAIAGAGVGSLIGANLGAIAVALFLIVGGIGAATGAGIYATIGNGSIWIAFIGSITASIALNFWINSPLPGIVSLAIAGTVEVLAGFVAHSAFAGNEKFTFVRQSALAFTTWGSTSFHKANLTNADFSFAKIAKTDFRYAVTTHTDFKGAIGSEYCRFEGTVLYTPEIREICVTRTGYKVFDGMSIRGVNWSEADLSHGSFIGSDLNEADLRGANFSGAKLIQTQLDQADLTQTCLTGAYIENWGITAETKLDGVNCEYVYMRLPTKDNPEPYRKPDNKDEKFKLGDFADFIRPIVETLDLYHNGTVDPRAVAISFKSLTENNPEANLGIVAMERRGVDKFLIRAKASEGANLSKLNEEYFSKYNQLLALPPTVLTHLIAEKDGQIQGLETTVATLLKGVNSHTEIKVEKVGIMHIQKVDTMHSNPGGISVTGGTIYGGLQVSQGDNTNQTMETSVSPAATEKQLSHAEVIDLLTQIGTMIHQAELPQNIKEESALYLGAAKKAVEKEEPKKALAAENLKSMAETLQGASKTMEASKSIWNTVKPILEQLPAWFGVASNFF